jgi:hypothetical protein
VDDRDQHEAGHRVDVEGEGAEAKHVAHQAVDQPGVRTEEIDESDRAEERGRQIRDRRGESDEALEWGIRAAHRPGHRQPQCNAEECHPETQNERIPERLEIEAVPERIPEVLQRESIFVADAPP